MKFRLLFLLIFIQGMLFGQNQIDIDAKFDMPNKTVTFNQHIRYQNQSQDTLRAIYLHDWINSFSSKSTPLAKRLTEEFSTRFHFAKDDERGYTEIHSIVNTENEGLEFEYLENHPDVLKVQLAKPLLPNEFYDIQLSYTSVIPDDVFTDYGVSKDGEFNLKYWYITPAVYDGEWQYYSNKNLDDLYVPKADITLKVEFPRNYGLYSELDKVNLQQNDSTQIYTLAGENRVDTKLFLNKFPQFVYTQTDKFTIITDLKENRVEPNDRTMINDQIAHFIAENLGEYPHEYLMLTNIEYKKDQLYGINQLPSFLRPFPDKLQYELRILKTALNNYLSNTMLINPREDYWLKDGIQIYYLMKYVEEHYPDLKLFGTLSNVWGLRSFHAADLSFNEQYNLYFMQMARTNRDQSLITPKDSLLKFNANIAGKYRAGIGLKYLEDFVNADIVEETLQEYLSTYKLQQSTSNDFEVMLKRNTNKDIDWFFTDYLETRKKIDFKIKDVSKTEDSITLTIKNKRDNRMPVSLFTLKNDSIVSKIWVENIDESKTITIPRNDANKLVLNYDNTIPEYNLRDNWKSLKGFFFNNKPLQFRLIKDVEDPNYNQVFFMPLVEFDNIYDGLTLGVKAYNKTLLRKNLRYQISPQYATRSQVLTGGTSVVYTHNIDGRDLYDISYGIGLGYASFAEDAFVTKINPGISFNFRDNSDFRSNQRNQLYFRYVDISRNVDNPEIVVDEPDYRVFDLRYTNSNIGIVNYKSWFADFQIAKNFGKLAFNYEIRKLTERNRQYNFRFFAGTFLYNNTEEGSDYFSFALDRPTDYLFDYNYLGRSEESGIFSQQIIIAEGGFKSMLEPAFANQWMTTVNASASIWRYIEAYGDFGLVKNSNQDARVMYDSGIRLNLVTDYFELYFPVYSNLGWEISQASYAEKIRIKFTLDAEALLGLFRRKWY